MAVLEAMLLPGSISRMELAAALGSLAGTLLSRRAVDEEKVVTAGSAVRIGSVGRTRAAPARSQWGGPMCRRCCLRAEAYPLRS